MSDGSAPRSAHDLADRIDDLDAAGCARLLSAMEVGRLAVVVDGHPRIVVLNYVMDGDDIQFRTSEDTAVAGLTLDGGVPAEFEVDGGIRLAASGWSVIARGMLVREPDADRAEAARERLVPWAGGGRDLVLRLEIDELTGREVGWL
jgi:uncharacterized protein